MQQYKSRADARAIVPYTPTVEDIALPPPITLEQPPQQSTSAAHDAIVGKTVTWANLGVTAIIIVALLRDGSKVQTALIVGGCYFVLATGLYVLTTSGTLTAIVNAWQAQRTERQRILAYRELGEMALEWRLSVEETRQMELLGRRPPAESVQRISPLNTFVPAFAEGEKAQVEGIRFAMSLYDTRGYPSRERVHEDGRLKIRMIASKRGYGSRESGLWLLRERIIERVKGGYRLNVESYPTRETLREFL